MAILHGTFTRRIFSSYPTKYHVLLFLDDDQGIVSVILHTNNLPPIDKRVRLAGRFRSSVDYGERFICTEWREEAKHKAMATTHENEIDGLFALLET